MIVAVTGATGFVGRHIVARLREHGHAVRVLARSPRRAPFPAGAVESVPGSLGDEAAIERLVSGADACIHLVGIIAQTGTQTFQAIHVAGTARVARAAQRAGVRRLAHMSAVGARPSPHATAYHRSKFAGETAARAEFPGAVVLRPAIIVGPESVPLRLLVRMHQVAPVIPVFGDGSFPLQPVWIGDVAEAFVRAVEGTGTPGVYELGGPEVLTYAAFVQAIGRAVGRPRPLAPAPLALVRLAARLFDVLPPDLAPITSDQLQMLVEGSVTPENAMERVFGIRPIALDAALRRAVGGSGERGAGHAGE